MSAKLRINERNAKGKLVFFAQSSRVHRVYVGYISRKKEFAEVTEGR